MNNAIKNKVEELDGRVTVLETINEEKGVNVPKTSWIGSDDRVSRADYDALYVSFDRLARQRDVAWEKARENRDELTQLHLARQQLVADNRALTARIASQKEDIARYARQSKKDTALIRAFRTDNEAQTVRIGELERDKRCHLEAIATVRAENDRLRSKPFGPLPDAKLILNDDYSYCWRIPDNAPAGIIAREALQSLVRKHNTNLADLKKARAELDVLSEIHGGVVTAVGVAQQALSKI